jgi:phage-related protein
VPWKIEYYNDKLSRVILKLPSGLLARYVHITDLMIQFGPNLGMPHTRSMGEKLFEIRLKSREGIGRVFYCTKRGKRIIMLHFCKKKSQKTPSKELKIARERLEEVVSNEP